MYIVVEIQTAHDGTVGTLYYPYEEEKAAMGKYHAVLSVAATNTNLRKHAAVIITEEGFHLRHECYEHVPPEPEPEEPEEEPGE